MNFPENFYLYLKNNRLVGIKGGTERENFLDIWMVEVNKRVFARSWNKSKHSWFTAIEELKVGQIKFGDQVIDITGRKLTGQPDLNALINQAYLHKYNQKENLFYAQ
ncbi:MAG: DUF2255 family protein, partial [Candidatus Brocadiia bacterium]